MSLATRLKELRIRNKKSLKQVADAVGASKTHIFDLEHGYAKNPSIELLEGIAAFYRTTVRDLIGENPDSPYEDDKIVAMYRELQKLSPGDRATIQVLMDRLREQQKEESES